MLFRIFAAMIVPLFLQSAPASAQPEQKPSMTKVADGVYHYFAMGYSSMVVVGRDAVLVTDTAFSKRAEDMKARIAGITPLPVRYVALSHEHFDHVGGTEVFKDAKVICHRACEEIFRNSPLVPMPKVDIAYSDSMTVDVGGKKVEIVHPAAGDGVATSVLWVPKDRVVFSTDMYKSREFVVSEFKEDTNFVGAKKILETMLSWNPVYSIGGHDPGNTLAALRENSEMMNKLHDAVLARFRKAMDEGGPLAALPLIFSLPNEMKMPEYGAWKGYDTAFPAYVRRMALSIFHGG